MSPFQIVLVSIVFIVCFIIIVATVINGRQKPKKKTSYTQSVPKQNSTVSIRQMAMGYIDTFFQQHPEFEKKGDILKVYMQTKQLIFSLSDLEFEKTALEYNGSVQSAALNIFQNCALHNVKPTSIEDFLSVGDEVVDLYNAINQEKLDLALITKEEYDENANAVYIIKSGMPIL